MSWRSSFKRSTAFSPFDATTTRYPRLTSIRRTVSRTAGSSSTSRMLGGVAWRPTLVTLGPSRANVQLYHNATRASCSFFPSFHRLGPRPAKVSDYLAWSLATPFNVVATFDVVGGNSGSPVVNANGEVVGVIFDGNIQSLPGYFMYDPAVNRAVAVDARGILAALETVYGAQRLVTEITRAAKP